MSTEREVWLKARKKFRAQQKRKHKSMLLQEKIRNSFFLFGCSARMADSALKNFGHVFLNIKRCERKDNIAYMKSVRSWEFDAYRVRTPL